MNEALTPPATHAYGRWHRADYDSYVELRTLGGLALTGTSFARPKPLLLLTYLAVEGPRPRRYLSELFWPGAARPMNSLRVALAQLRGGAPGVLAEADGRLAASVDVDAARLLRSLEGEGYADAVEAYQGAFLDGLRLAGIGTELEEWIFGTREELAERVRDAALLLGERDAAAGVFASGAARARAALEIAGAPPPRPDDLVRIHTLLKAGESPAARAVAREAAPFELMLAASGEEARERLTASGVDVRGTSARLPTALTSFVGRDLERLDLARLLEDGTTRLITITGPGGVGKSRLALEAAHAALADDRFPDGVAFAALAAVQGDEHLLAAVAAAFDVALPGRDARRDELIHALAGLEALLVLDDCEHLPACPPLVAHLLAACPGIKVLASSRVPLDVAGEQRFAIEGLAVGDGSADVAPYQDAVLLFVGRARRMQPRFDLDDENLPHVLTICRLVQGSPLGIELAAAWVRFMSPEAIATEIERNLDFLQVRTRGVSERHTSLRATFEHSWNLLSGSQREALRRISVFASGFTRSAASRVAGATIPVLASLADRSLLRPVARERYERHPLVQRYAAEKLAQDPEEERRVRAAHAAFCLSLAEGAAASRRGEQQAEALLRLEREHDELRAALAWCLGGGDRALGLSLAASAYRFWYYRSHFEEGRRWLERALESVDEGADVPPELREKALHGVGVLASELGDDSAAVAAFEARLDSATERGDEVGRAASLNSLGVVAWRRGEHARARDLLERSLTLRRKTGRRELLSGPLANLGLVALAQDDFEGARAFFDESFVLSREGEDAMGCATALSNLGAVSVDLGEAGRAHRLLEEALGLYRSLGDRAGVAHCLDGFAAVACLEGRHAAAARLAGSAAAVREAIGAEASDAERARNARRMAPAREALGEAAFERAFRAGRAGGTADAETAARTSIPFGPP